MSSSNHSNKSPSNETIQTLVDSLCQCFGSSPVPLHEEEEAFQTSQAKQKQWDTLFKTPRNASTMDHAHAVAKAKLVKASAQKKRLKRKRTSSRDDIFRSKKAGDTTSPSSAFRRFLSNNPVIMHSLCFATPVRDSASFDATSVVSESATLNTAEDTITSTLYYEKTKLAGMEQKSPPMPLFNNFAVEEKDKIHTIVTSHSHSSVKLLDMYQSLGENVELEDDDEDDEDPTPPSTPQRGTEPPPPVTKASSDSST